MSGVATGRIMADVAWGARGVEIRADLIATYSGSAFAGVDQIRAWNRPYLLGFESSTTRPYAGGPAGAVDASALLAVARSIPGYAGCGFWFCAADASSTPAQFLANITDYAESFARFVIDNWGNVPLLAYGNRAAVEAAVAGILRAGGIPLRWGVGTWGYGEGGGPNRLPASSDADVLQSGNTPGPVPGETDFNALYVPLDAFRAMGGPAAAPEASPTPKGKRMELLHGPTPFGRLAILLDPAGDEVGRWTSTGREGVDTVFGVPKPAADVMPKGTNLVGYADVELWKRQVNLIDARKARQAAPPGAGVALTDAQVTAIAKQVQVPPSTAQVDAQALADALIPHLKVEVKLVAA